MSKPDRAAALALIQQNIQKSGFHIYIVSGGNTPRFAYTIGLSESLGAELVVAGAIDYVTSEANEILHVARKHLAASGAFDSVIAMGELGSFTLREVHGSWTQRLLLGAMDYYRRGDIRAYQILPDRQHWTVDVPDMAREWRAATEPVWRWLEDEWSYAVPDRSTVTANLAALRGGPITRVARREENEWEMYADSRGVTYDEETRTVPLACVLGADPALVVALDLEIGKGLWRDNDGGDWYAWDPPESDSDDPS